MGRIRGVILAGLGGFGIGMILCRLYALEPEHSLVFALAALLGAAAGGAALRGDSSSCTGGH